MPGDARNIIVNIIDMRKILQECDRDIFCQMWREGKSIDSMAEYFGLSPETIRKYARTKYKLPLRQKTCRHSILGKPEKVSFLKKNYADMGTNICAVLIGENPDWVRRTAKLLGLSHSEKYPSEDYTFRAKKTSATRKIKFASGEYSKTPRDIRTGRFVSKTT